MATTNEWELSGEYFETCSCDYLCPCIISTNFSARPTKGWCAFAMVFQIQRGRFGSEALDGLSFAVIGRTPGVMLEGSWEVGLITDQRAKPAQQQALGAIVGGQAGGPMANLAPLLGKFLGVESKPIQFQSEGMQRSVSIPGVLEQALTGVGAAEDAREPMHVDNTLHPANPRLALAKATRSHLHAFGIDWDDDSGKNNGHFAPFAWKGAVPASQEAAQPAQVR
ncbi:MAG: DUF1326 domain-containing protein [Chloroflexi bacterium]|nr:MAG: DUF1326 domain-containing protein [Chloroflexota bacterium]